MGGWSVAQSVVLIERGPWDHGQDAKVTNIYHYLLKSSSKFVNPLKNTKNTVRRNQATGFIRVVMDNNEKPHLLR